MLRCDAQLKKKFDPARLCFNTAGSRDRATAVTESVQLFAVAMPSHHSFWRLEKGARLRFRLCRTLTLKLFAGGVFTAYHRFWMTRLTSGPEEEQKEACYPYVEQSSIYETMNFTTFTGDNKMKRTFLAAVCCLTLAVMAMATSTVSAQLAVGESIGIDFGTTGTVFGADSGVAPAAGTNFNEFNTQTEDGATASAGSLITLDGSSTSVGFSITNNAGKDSGLTGIASQAGPAPFDDATIGGDNYGAANVGNLTRADGGLLATEDLEAGIAEANFVLTFSGLDDSLAYTVSGGYLHGSPNDNFNLTLAADGQAVETLNTSGLPDAGYATLQNLSTDGSGNLEITVTRAAVQLFISAVTIEATVASQDCLLGDVDLNGAVEFLDIQPFIDVLSSNGFQCEADCNESGAVDFLDIAAFISILSGS